jgi:hypothetical protein
MPQEKATRLLTARHCYGKAPVASRAASLSRALVIGDFLQGWTAAHGEA